MGLLGGALQAMQTGQLETRERGQGVCRLQGASLKHISPRAGILPSSPTPAWGAAPRSHTSRPRAPLLPHEGSGRGGGGWIDPQVPVLPELVKADARSRWLGDQLQNKSSGWRGLGSLCVEQGSYHHKLGAARRKGQFTPGPLLPGGPPRVRLGASLAGRWALPASAQPPEAGRQPGDGTPGGVGAPREGTHLSLC